MYALTAKGGELRARAKVGRKAWFKGRCVVQAHRVRESAFVLLNLQDDVANDRAGLDCTVGVGDLRQRHAGADLMDEFALGK